MKNRKITLLVVAFFLTSCVGTQIQIPSAVPAKLNMRRDARVMVGCEGNTACGVADYLEGMIRHDGYYTLVEDKHSNPEYLIYLDTNFVNPVQEKVRCRIYRYPSMRRVYEDIEQLSLSDIGNIWKNFLTWNLQECTDGDESLALKFYKKIAPREIIYKTRVKTNSENPKLREAVQAFKKRNTALSHQLLMEAIQQKSNDSETLYMLALLESSKSNFAASNQYLTRAIQLNPDENKYKQALARNSIMQKNEEAAIEQLSGE